MAKCNQISISEFSKNGVESDTHLVLLNLENIPPHLGLLIHGDYFSISTINRAISIPVSKLLGKIIREKIPTIFVKIPDIGDKEGMIACVKNLPLVEENSTKCIDPIIDFAENNGYQFDNQKYMVDLLEKTTVIDAMSLFADDFICSGVYTIPEYTDVEIQNVIRNSVKH